MKICNCLHLQAKLERYVLCRRTDARKPRIVVKEGSKLVVIRMIARKGNVLKEKMLSFHR